VYQDEQLVFSADRYSIKRVRFQTPDGRQHARDIIRHPGAVVLLPVLPDGRIVMIENYRVSLDRTLLEVPAGTMEPGEAAASTAARELSEETGYRAGKLQLMRTFYASPGICDEAMHLFLATELVAGDAEREVYEQIENKLVTPAEAKRLVADGTIQDAKTLVALLSYAALS
jgi:ADP-ribose pyrophosphatase